MALKDMKVRDSDGTLTISTEYSDTALVRLPVALDAYIKGLDPEVDHQAIRLLWAAKQELQDLYECIGLVHKSNQTPEDFSEDYDVAMHIKFFMDTYPPMPLTPIELTVKIVARMPLGGAEVGIVASEYPELNTILKDLSSQEGITSVRVLKVDPV